NHECVYDLQCASAAAKVEFTCEHFELQKTNPCKSNADFLKLKDVSGQLGRYCGKSGPTGVVSGSDFLEVKFKTNGETQRTGFFCWAKCSEETTTPITTTTTNPTTTTTMPITTTNNNYYYNDNSYYHHNNTNNHNYYSYNYNYYSNNHNHNPNYIHNKYSNNFIHDHSTTGIMWTTCHCHR
ncbi:unnamed protein product, partial [Meganyctiphanes norvegica]